MIGKRSADEHISYEWSVEDPVALATSVRGAERRWEFGPSGETGIGRYRH